MTRATAVVWLLWGGLAAAGHRDAPGTATDPTINLLDVYAFRSPERSDSLSIIATVLPFEGSSGPTPFGFADEVDYEIRIELGSPFKTTVTYRFEFATMIREPNAVLSFTGSMTLLSDPGQNVFQRYTLTEIVSDTSDVPPTPEDTIVSTEVLGVDLPVPPIPVGPKTIPNYGPLADAAVCSTGGCNARAVIPPAGSDQIKFFAGPRDDPAFMDLQFWDQLTLRGQPAPIGYDALYNQPLDGLRGYNVHAIALQIPISRLVGPSTVVEVSGGLNDDPVLGIWAVARRAAVRTTGPFGSTAHSGALVQVARTGNPLFSAAILPLSLRDAFNSLAVATDLPLARGEIPGFEAVGALLLDRIQRPELVQRMNALYGFSAPLAARSDVVDLFLNGLLLGGASAVDGPGGAVNLPAGYRLNRPASAGATRGEAVRLNTSITAADCPVQPHRLGFLGRDLCGYPNGRRLTDDVVDIVLKYLGGAAWRSVTGDTGFTIDSATEARLADGVDANDVPFENTFPYLALPHSGELLSGVVPTTTTTTTMPGATTTTLPLVCADTTRDGLLCGLRATLDGATCTGADAGVVTRARAVLTQGASDLAGIAGTTDLRPAGKIFGRLDRVLTRLRARLRKAGRRRQLSTDCAVRLDELLAKL